MKIERIIATVVTISLSTGISTANAQDTSGYNVNQSDEKQDPSVK